jgi:hypothetical protein
MDINLKYRVLAFIMMLMLCSACNLESTYLTEVSGKVHNTEACNSDFLYIYESLEDTRIVDSFSISADDTYYVAFSGAILLELRGSEFCGSDYHIISRGYRQTNDFSFKPVRSGIKVNVNPDRIHSSVKHLSIFLTRLMDTGNKSFFLLPNDIHNVRIRLKEPLDTLINLTLVDQQFYRRSISGSDSLFGTIFSIFDTIKVDANLHEIIF